MIVTEMRKEKNLLYVNVENRKNPYVIDFTTGDIYGANNKLLNNSPFPSQDSFSIQFMHNVLSEFGNDVCRQYARLFAFGGFNRRYKTVGYNRKITPEYKSGIQSSEKFIPYLNELLDNNIEIDDINTKLPKGYIKWILNIGKDIGYKSINTDSLNFFKLSTTKQISQADLKFYHFVKTQSYGHYPMYQRMLNNPIEFLASQECKALKQILRNSFNNWDITVRDILQYDLTDYMDIIDITKDIKTNCNLIQMAQNKIQNEKIIKNQSTITFLEDINFGNYTIIVPKCVEDLKSEGEQQHNCVGYHYNNSIANGNDLIYFIRIKNHIKQSFVTCRTNHLYYTKWTTCEYRTVNNNCVPQIYQCDINKIVQEVDKQINAVLGQPTA